MGTLRCAQAIVKMQALVRARRAHLSLEGSSIQEKLDKQPKINHQRANPLVMFVLSKKRRWEVVLSSLFSFTEFLFTNTRGLFVSGYVTEYSEGTLRIWFEH